MSIQSVISLSFTVVTVIGMLFMGAALFLRFSAGTRSLTEQSSTRLLGQVNINLDGYLRRMMRVSDAIYYRSIKNADLSVDSIFNDISLLYDENRDAVVSIVLFDTGGGLVSAIPLNTLKLSVTPSSEEWFVSAMEKMENFHFSAPHVQNLFDDPDHNYNWVVSLSRHVELTRSGATGRGVLLVDMNFSGIEQICRDVTLPENGYIYLIDGGGEIIYHPSQQLIYAGLATENNLMAARYPDGVNSESYMGNERVVILKTVGYTGWKLVGVIPEEDITSDYQQILFFAVSLLMFSVFLMAYLNFRISARISDPIRRLEASVKELEMGRRDVMIVQDGTYEVERLSRSIRSMVTTMHRLMDDVVRQEAEKRKNELEVLQSQINPHFLYNTLDSVIWMTENGRNEDAIMMVTSLARFFRISLSRGHSIIPLKDELEHARHYMNIQGIRYKNKFTTRIEAHENTEGCYCLKLILQPLLENAIYHGLSAGVDEGSIVVRAEKIGNDLLIDVSDNGIGMPAETKARLLSDVSVQRDTSVRQETQTQRDKDARHDSGVRPDGTGEPGIGVRNVHQRIRLTFGARYGLTIYSEPDEGTTVSIRLPADAGG